MAGTFDISTINVISPNGLVTKSLSVTNDGMLMCDAQQIVTQNVIKRYGFRRAKNNSDPNTRIEYLYDAVGMTPHHLKRLCTITKT